MLAQSNELESVAKWAVVLVGSGGIIGAVVALLKVRPDAGQITVTAAQGALIVQTGVIETLREENSRLADRIDAIEEDNERCHQRLEEVQMDLALLRGEILPPGNGGLEPPKEVN